MRSLTQIVLLFVYFAVVFVVSRMLDLVMWYQHGVVSTQAVDPLVMSVRQLKQLLQNRGVSYAGFVEKQDLVQLVEASAELVQGEVDGQNAGNSETTHPAPSRLTGSSHFYQQVEDNKDGALLVQVVPASTPETPRINAKWRTICDLVAPFDIRTGVLDCQLDRHLCANKGWYEPMLILALPKDSSTKERVVLRTFPLSKPQLIVDWVHNQLSSNVKIIDSLEDVERDWLRQASVVADTTTDRSSYKDVKVLLLTHLFSPPLFLAALSIKFTGRITFGMFTVRKEDTETVRKRLKLTDHRIPAYLVVTPERKLVYGRRRFEHFNFKSMNLFLRAVQPEMNDVFLCSLVLVNMLVSLQIFQVSVRLWWKHIARCLWTVVSYNCWLFATWLLILATYRFSLVTLLADKCLVLVRYASLTEIGAVLRSDWLSLSQHLYLLFSTFFLYGWAATWLIKRRYAPDPEQALSETDRPWWEVLPVDSHWINCFFRPMGSMPRPLLTSEVELEEGIDMLIERLAVPNLWLQPVIATEYIKNLPVWKHRGWDQSLSKAEAKWNVTLVMSEQETIERIMDGDDPDVSACRCCRDDRLKYRLNRGSPKRGRKPSVCESSNSTNKDDTTQSSLEASPVGGVEMKHCADESGCVCAIVRACGSLSEDSGTDDGNACVPPSGMRQTTECAVCLEPYGWGALLCGLPCGHSYHQGCIMVWLQRDNHHCPVCRWPAYKHKHAHHE